MTAAPRSAALLASRPRSRRRSSLRVIVPFASALLLAGAMLTSAFVAERQTREMLVSEARTRLALEAELLARASASAMLEGFPELTLQPILKDLLRGRNLSTAMVIDREGRVLAHPDPRRIGDYAPLGNASAPSVGEARVREEGKSLVAIMPIRHASGSVLGHAIVTMPRAPLERALAHARARQWWIAGILVVLSSLLTFLLMSRLLSPITRLREGLERIGRGDLDTRLALSDGTELGLLADTLDEMAGRLAVAQRSQLERERLAAELEAAGRIQTILHPAAAVRRRAYVVTGHQRPAAEVGGDYFDAIELPDGRLGLVIADVSGKGLAGCLVTFMMAALVRVLREREPSPSRLLMEVDRHLRPVLEPGAFVTAWYGVLDPLTGDVTFASAGHLPTLLRRADGSVERHATKGIPLGLLAPQALAKGLRDVRTRLEPGDALLQFTDGFTEAVAPDGLTQMGIDGVQRALEEGTCDSADSVLARLCGAAEGWTHGAPPDDDQTAIVVRRDKIAGEATLLGDGEVEAWVARARAAGHGLGLRADLAELDRLRPWLRSPLGPGVPENVTDWLESALYEVCGNVVEHGYDCDGQGVLELWWLKQELGPPAAGGDAPVVRGWFVLIERGKVFDLSAAVPADFTRLEARLKGRGLGVAMIRRLMPRVLYRAGTAEGNVTLIEFDSEQAHGVMKGVRDERCA